MNQTHQLKKQSNLHPTDTWSFNVPMEGTIVTIKEKRAKLEQWRLRIRPQNLQNHWIYWGTKHHALKPRHGLRSPNSRGGNTNQDRKKGATKYKPDFLEETRQWSKKAYETQ
jgi:hypothetical protein